MLNLAYLSLGSNIDPERNLISTVKLLADRSRLVAVSSVWRTLPLGITDQPDFLNAAAVVETELAAGQFKQRVIRRIERLLKRDRTGHKYGPRTIDIDLILFNREIFMLDGHPIPDPELMERPFIGIPLAEIAPEYVHPETGQTLRQMAQRFEVPDVEMRLRQDISRALSRQIIEHRPINRHAVIEKPEL